MKTIRLNGFYISTIFANGVLHSGTSFCRQVAIYECLDNFKQGRAML
jgi:hypothetical protein